MSCELSYCARRHFTFAGPIAEGHWQWAPLADCVWGEAMGLARENVDPLRSRLTVVSTAIEVGGAVHFGQEPTTTRSRRTVPIAQSVMSRVAEHLDRFVAPEPDASGFTTASGGSLYRGTFGRQVWRPAVVAAGVDSFTFHGLRHSSWRFWRRPAATFGRCRSGPGTTVSRSL